MMRTFAWISVLSLLVCVEPVRADRSPSERPGVRTRVAMRAKARSTSRLRVARRSRLSLTALALVSALARPESSGMPAETSSESRQPVLSNDQRAFLALFERTHRRTPERAHAQTLINVFQEDGISGENVRDRFVSLLELTRASGPPIAHFDEATIRATGRAFYGRGDSGFRRELQDSVRLLPNAAGEDVPLHRDSSDQIGHFLTAAHIGFYLRESELQVEARKQLALRNQIENPTVAALHMILGNDPEGQMERAFVLERTQYIRAMIGHELIGDDRGSDVSGVTTILAPVIASEHDIEEFVAGRIRGIPIDDHRWGTSFQDLALSWVGYRFGEHIASGRFGSLTEASRWLEVMLTEYDLSSIQASDPFHADVEQLKVLLADVRHGASQ